jgi:hypothetical protein
MVVDMLALKKNGVTHNCDSVIKIVDGFAFQQGRFHESSEMQVFPKSKQSKLIGYDGEDVDESNELGLSDFDDDEG